MSIPDVAVIGGGVIGCAIARELACAGAGRIMVIDRGESGGAASKAAAGVLALSSGRAPGGALFELRRAGVAMFPSLSRELLESTGVDIEYRPGGLLKLAFTDKEAAELRAQVAKRGEQGFTVEWLQASAVGRVEPGVNGEICGAAYFGDDGAVNNERLVDALRRDAEARGVVFRDGTDVTGLETGDSRVLALVAGGERLTPGMIVIAAGAWSPEIGRLLRVKIPVRPDKGEMVALRGDCSLSNTISWGDGYLAPRNDGEILVGSTSARGVFDTSVTPESIDLLLGRAVRMVPALSKAEVVRKWAGLRPMPTIRRPILAPLRGYENVILATGHHRSGILLAPITGKLITEMILQQATSIPLHPFCYKPR